MAYLWRIVLSRLDWASWEGCGFTWLACQLVSFMILPDQLRYPFTFSEQLKFSKTTTVLDSQMLTLSMYVHVCTLPFVESCLCNLPNLQLGPMTHLR